MIIPSVLNIGIKMKNIVLASTSPRRQELMENVGLLFDIVSPNFLYKSLETHNLSPYSSSY